MISDVNMLILCSSGASAATAALCFAGQRWLGDGFLKGGRLTASPDTPTSEVAVQAGPKSLDDAHIRERMTAFLAKHEITGDADVRDGQFYPPVPAERIGPLAQILERAWGALQRVQNRNACSLYFRDSVNDRFNLVPDLDLDDIGEVLRVMQRVAADRKKSRSLYKGISDDEIHALVVSGLATWLQNHGEDEAAHAVKNGDRAAFAREMLVAREVLMLAFQVKRTDV